MHEERIVRAFCGFLPLLSHALSLPVLLSLHALRVKLNMSLDGAHSVKFIFQAIIPKKGEE
jgi:hypothetical protein